jgi:hypothetical protein
LGVGFFVIPWWKLFDRPVQELFRFDLSSDPGRLNRLMDEGGYYPASPDVAFARIEVGEDFSLFRIIFASADLWPGEMPALWFRNRDMVVEGSNAPDCRVDTPRSR